MNHLQVRSQLCRADRSVLKSGRSHHRSRQRSPLMAFPLTMRCPQPRLAWKSHLNGCQSKQRTPISRASLQYLRSHRLRRSLKASETLCRSMDGRQQSNGRRGGTQAMVLFRRSRVARVLPLSLLHSGAIPRLFTGRYIWVILIPSLCGMAERPSQKQGVLCGKRRSVLHAMPSKRQSGLPGKPSKPLREQPRPPPGQPKLRHRPPRPHREPPRPP